MFVYLQYTALLCALILYSSLRRRKMEVFFWICLVSVVVETLSGLVIEKKWFAQNYFVINFYFLLTTPLFLYAFYQQLQMTPRQQRSYKSVSLLIMAGFLYNILLGEGFNNLNTLTIIMQQFINVLLSCMLLFNMAVRDDYFLLSREPMFWISAGILIFSLGTLVSLGMSQFIRMNQITINNKNLYRITMPVLNIILYLSYTIGFILCTQKKKSYSPSL